MPLPTASRFFALGRRRARRLARIPRSARGSPRCSRATASSRSRCSSFPVSVTHIGQPRRVGVAGAPRRRRTRAGDDVDADGRRAGRRIPRDARLATSEEAARAGRAFVEIQNTMLFATVGQRTEAEVGDGPRSASSRACLESGRAGPSSARANCLHRAWTELKFGPTTTSDQPMDPWTRTMDL